MPVKGNEMVVVRLINMEFAELKYSETGIEWPVDKNSCSFHIDDCLAFIENTLVPAMWLSRQFDVLLAGCGELNVGSFLLVLAGFAIYRINHLFEMITLEVTG